MWFYAVARGDHWIRVLMLVPLSEFLCGHSSIIPDGPGTCGVRHEHVELRGKEQMLCGGTGPALVSWACTEHRDHTEHPWNLLHELRRRETRKQLRKQTGGSQSEGSDLLCVVAKWKEQEVFESGEHQGDGERVWHHGRNLKGRAWLLAEPPRLPAGIFASVSAHLVTQGVGVAQVYWDASSGCWPSHWLVAWGPPLLLAFFPH